MNTDPVADYLTRIRNANQAGLKTVEIPSSNLKVEMTKILLDQGFILNYKIIEDNLQGKVKIALKYDKISNEPVIKKLQNVEVKVDGLILNDLDTSKASYYGYYQYGGYSNKYKSYS